jgi:hypothetical protein
MADIQRRLDTTQEIYINKWWTGLYKNRSPLFTPVSAMGIQLIARMDALWDGANIMITPRYSLQRRYGFVRYCPSQVILGVPLTFFSYQDLTGNVYPLVDTTTAVQVFTPLGLTTLFTKSGGASQTSFQAVLNTLYFVNGVDLQKWTNESTLSQIGINAPTVAPSLSYSNGGVLQPIVGYSYGYCFQNSTTKHLSTMSPISADTGPLNNQTVAEHHTVPGTGPYTITVNNSATFLADEGVVVNATNVPLTVVAGSPGSGQYSVTSGVYTFNIAQAGVPMQISYAYALTGGTGMNITVQGSRSVDAQVDKVVIFRTDDGGAEYFFLSTVNNPGSGGWSYTDNTPDSGLNDLDIAPVDFANNPPPTGLSLLTWYAGRLWGASGNTLYFSGGPDTINGVGEESWPPANNFPVPGSITALAPTSNGLVVWTKDDAYVVTGNSSSTFTAPMLWQLNWGVQNQNCVSQDGDNIFIITSRGQIFNFSANGLNEIGALNEYQLAAFNPANSYIVVHRSGPDEGVFVCDGSANIYRYSQVANAWDTVIIPAGGCKAIASIEVSPANWKLMMGRASTNSYLLARDLNTFTDDEVTYPAWVTVGSITVAPPRKVANLDAVLTQFMPVGTYPTVSVLLNEVADLGIFPATFVALPHPVPDPPQLPPTQTIWTRRHDFKAAQNPLSGHVSHLQVKIQFKSEAQQNEILGIGLS